MDNFKEMGFTIQILNLKQINYGRNDKRKYLVAE